MQDSNLFASKVLYHWVTKADGHPFNLELWNVDISGQFVFAAVTYILRFFFFFFLHSFQKVQIICLARDTRPNLKLAL